MQSQLKAPTTKGAAQKAARLPSAVAVRPATTRRALRTVAAVAHDFNAKVFKKELTEFAGTEEYIVRGGRDKFPLLKQVESASWPKANWLHRVGQGH